MITVLSTDVKFNTKEQKALVVGSAKPTAKNKTLKLYLPLLMDGITFDKPKISTIGKLNTSIYINDPACKPKVSKKIIKHQNYLTGSLSNNSNTKTKQKKTTSGGNVTNTFIKHNTELRAKFLNHKLSKLRANTDE